jgi:hypothetical protein
VDVERNRITLVWKAFIWLRVGGSNGHLWKGFTEVRGISLPADGLETVLNSVYIYMYIYTYIYYIPYFPAHKTHRPIRRIVSFLLPILENRKK